jgi:drug/metabolite transporter (DMT)-like permease
MILTIQPIASVALGAILLGQDPSVLQLCGVALILAGLMSVAIRPRRVARA